MVTWEEMKEYHKELANKYREDFHQHRSGGWIENTAKVTRSIVAGQSLILGNANVDLCELRDQSIIKDKATVVRSYLAGWARVEDNAFVDQSTISCESIIKGNADVRETTVIDRSMIIDNANVEKSRVSGESIIKGVSTLIQCNVHTAMININECAVQTTLYLSAYDNVPVTINTELLGYAVSFDANIVRIGCKRRPLDWWKKNAKEIRKDYVVNIAEQDVDKVIEAIRLLQEVYKRNTGD